MNLLGRLYVTGSLAALPAAAVALWIFLRNFKEHGSHSQGAGAAAMFALGLLAGLGVNALVAGVLAIVVPATRTSWVHVLATVVALDAAFVAYFFLVMKR